MSTNNNNRKTLSGGGDNKTERYRMTRDRDINIALDVLMAIPGNEGIVHNGNYFWLTDRQASLLRTMGASFAKSHVKKWIPDTEVENNEIVDWGLNKKKGYMDGQPSPERKKL